ncbi:ComEC/Rec2 family competence protein [Bifidobacterium amazonense]|uniref:ComEC/Rec2 family competence protein n=1 Tax=Bifidobacterium amazonense TaxID=2809027 RepID=A0ABS9VYM3_9BIFI|nr:ComEC/Rec2 family competence protein [Bifidobacterium amazonense]MCH9277016.1 ComEC/Rec2 family competence protein [Bifidobacterium amazonense]
MNGLRPYGHDREQGSRDWRMLPVAAAVWASSLATHLTFTWLMEPTDGSRFSRLAAALTPLTVLCGGLVAIGMAGRSVRRRFRWRRDGRRIDCCDGRRDGCYVDDRDAAADRDDDADIGGAGTGLSVVIVAALLAALAALSADLAQWHDPANALARERSPVVTATVRIVTPLTAADIRGQDCQADGRIVTLRDGEVERSSTADVRVYATEADCATLADGATVFAQGTLQQARYGRQPLWLVVDMPGSMATVRQAGPGKRVVAHMQDAFFAVTERLSDQGRVLVPGLTLGVLGQDHVVTGNVTVKRDEAGAAELNATYAATVEEHFRRSGIMHLMAVSGGHFMLVAGMVRRLCARFLMPRQVVSGCVAGAYLLLAAAMYPSDSVMRALVMGLLGAAALFVGRRGQPVSALGWTVIGVLLIRPGMAASYGFALSCAAVLGIVLFCDPIGGLLGHVLPRFLAEPLAMTVAAQSLTLPIQVLMEPELSLASVPANLLVSPFVDFATIAGLAALLVSWASPQAGFALAWVASCGTQVMERVAAWLAAGRYAVIPWAGGVGGALLMLATETALAGLLGVVIPRLVRRVRGGHQPCVLASVSASALVIPSSPGEPFRPGLRARISRWIAETKTLFGRDGSG